MLKPRCVVVPICLILSSAGFADTIQTIGAGSAVTTVDRLATFDGLDYLHNGTALSDYTEHQLFIGTSGDSLAGWGPGVTPFFDPFHIGGDPNPSGFYYTDGGSTDWTTIETTDAKKIYGLEFLYGNGWTTGDINGVPWGNSNAYVTWQTIRNGSVVSTGQIGVLEFLSVGTVIGFSDTNGFDTLKLKCLSAQSADPNLQALALDDLSVQLTPVPEPATLAALSIGLFALLRRRRTSSRG